MLSSGIWGRRFVLVNLTLYSSMGVSSIYSTKQRLANYISAVTDIHNNGDTVARGFLHVPLWHASSVRTKGRVSHPQDGGDMFLRNVGSHKSHTASYPRRRHSSSQYKLASYKGIYYTIRTPLHKITSRRVALKLSAAAANTQYL
jgi:hypothetical protein